jgi:hypothetical protein
MLTLSFERLGGTTRVTIGPRGQTVSVQTESLGRLFGALRIPFDLADVVIEAKEGATDGASMPLTISGPVVATVPNAFSDDQWSLVDVSTVPGQFSPSMWSLEDV